MDTTDFNTSYEPMDIDTSAHSNNEMEISFIIKSIATSLLPQYEKEVPIAADDETAPAPSPETTQQPTVTNIKKFHIKIQKDTNPNGNTNIIMIICAAIVLFLSIIVYKALDIHCSNDINTEMLNNILSSKLYGQSKAIETLIEALNIEEKNKVLFFYGGTGVGKTYTTSLIMDHVGHHSNVYHYTMPTFTDTFTTDFMIGLTVCKHSTVIVDDLNPDIDIITHIQDLITKSQHLNKNVTVILIYNCAKDLDTQCDTTFANKLLYNFNHIDAFKMLIKFEPLKTEHLRKCIENELGNKELDNIEFGRIAKNFNVTMDGCKGVYNKMKVLGIS